MESIHDVSEGFLTYDDRQDITAHHCSVDLIELYRNHLAIHLNASKESLLEEYQKRYEIEEIEGEAFQALQEKHSQVLADCQQN